MFRFCPAADPSATRMIIESPPNDVVDWLVLGLAYFALSLLAAAMIISGLRQYRQGKFANWTWKWTPWKMCEGISHKNIQNDIQSKIKTLTERRQRDFSRRAIFLGCPATTATLIILLYTSAVYDQGKGSLNLMQGHTMLLSFSVVVFAGCLAFEGQPGYLFRTLVSVATMTRMAITVMMYETSEQILFDRYNVAVARICVALVIGGSLKLTILLNILYACCPVAAWAKLMSDGEPLDAKYGGSRSLLWFSVHELLLTLALCVIAVASEKRTLGEAIASIQAKADRTAEKAVRRLLTTSYDVVMQLSERLVIQQDAFELSAFLMRGTDRSAKGRTFTDYIDSAQDREEFEKAMQNKTGDDTCMAAPIYVKLRDGSGAVLPVEIMRSQFLDAEDQLQHLIGIRERDKEYLQQLPPLEPLKEHRNDISISKSSSQSRRSNLRSQRGTPAMVEPSSMDDHSDAASVTSSDGTLSQAPALMRPDMQPSSLGVQAASLMALLFSWNLHVRRVSCCEYHDLAKEACALLRQLSKCECMSREDIRKSRIFFDHQCSNCGIIFPRTSTNCYLCAMAAHKCSTCSL